MALAALVAGLAIAAAAQLSGPVVLRPLYDGVVVAEPYRWLDPPPGLEGGAQGVRNVVPAAGGGMSVDTPEIPPQAQVDTDYSALALPAGTTSIVVTIRPIKPPAAAPSDGEIAGNVYDLEAVNQRGAVVSIAPGQRVTMLFRGPPSLPSGRIERYAGGTWTVVETDPAGIPDMYTTLDDSFGVYALVAPPGWQPAGVRGNPTPGASAATATASEGPLASLASAGATAARSLRPISTPDAATRQGAGTSEGSQSPGPLLPITIVLAVVAAVAFVLLRPVKPPPG